MAKKGLFKELIAKRILVSTNKNRLRIFKSIDMSMYGGTSWPLTIQTIGRRMGHKRTFDCGFLMGKDIADELKSMLKNRKAFLPKSVLVVDNLIQATGFGVVEIQFKSNKEMVLNIIENAMLDLAAQEYGEKSFVGTFYAGVYSAMAGIFLGFSQCNLKYDPCKSGGKLKHVFRHQK